MLTRLAAGASVRGAATALVGQQALVVRALSSSAAGYENILVEKRPADRTALVTLNRPKALNALCDALISELNHATKELDLDPEVGAIVVTGSSKAFAAGADIKEMAPRDYIQCYTKNMFADWANLSKVQTPTIAAVNGFALGGGCELAMLCDIIVAGDKAKFGQPRDPAGHYPWLRRHAAPDPRCRQVQGHGAHSHRGANHRRGGQADGTRGTSVPRCRARGQGPRHGQEDRVHVQAHCANGQEAVNASYEMTLEEGARFERRIFHSTFSTHDRREGMAAFVEKRKANFKHE